MPRRGEHQRDFPAIDQPAPPERIGVRVVRAPDRIGGLREMVFDPAGFGCRTLAGELADEWVDYIEVADVIAETATGYRRAIGAFCAMVDSVLGDGAGAASLARPDPDLAAVLLAWERTLPAGFPAGSATPALLAWAVRALIARRVQHDQRPVCAQVCRVVEGAMGVARGVTREVDEFSRADKRALVRAAWQWVHELDQRLTAGWALVRQGAHPAEHGWTSVANLLWGLAHEQISGSDIRANVPALRSWPPELRGCIERPGQPAHPWHAKEVLVRRLARQLYPDSLDLHAFRVLLVAATGHTPDEVTGLGEDDVEFLPSGVRLTLTKRRARRVVPRIFNDVDPSSAVSRESVEFTDQPRREVSAIIRLLLRATEPSRRRGSHGGRLFVAVSVPANYELRFVPWGRHHRPPFLAD